jgi:CRISPR-associated protein Cmr1
MFLGNADQDAEWRAAPFKSLLRYWWRVTQKDHSSFEKLRERENLLFGCAGDTGTKGVGKSLVSTAVFSDASPCLAPLKHNEQVEHPEMKKYIDPLLYLGGMGLLNKGIPQHSYFPAGSSFEWEISYPLNPAINLHRIFGLIRSFGTIGARCRNGWGSFYVVAEDENLFSTSTLHELERDWRQAFAFDYPHCLGRDTLGSLIWKTTKAHGDWKGTMRELADVYIALRARTVSNIDKLDPGSNSSASERHLFGIPLTHHNAWGNQARHASPLRFVVHRQPDGQHRGFILHVPHRFSQELAQKYPKFTAEYQIKVWEKVHKKLDNISSLKRAQYKDCI